MFFFQALPPSSINFTPLKQVILFRSFNFYERICLKSLTTIASFDAKAHVLTHTPLCNTQKIKIFIGLWIY